MTIFSIVAWTAVTGIRFQKVAVLYHSTTWMSFVSVPPAG